MKKQRGQSLVEFAAGTSALVLLLLGVITLSGFQEVQRRGISATRQLAFEAVSWSGPVRDEVNAEHAFAHHFDDGGMQDAVGRARYVGEEDVEVSQQAGRPPGLADHATTLLMAPLRVGSTLMQARLDLETGGYVTGELVLRLAPHQWLPEPFRDLDLLLRQPYAILSDAWNAAGPPHVKERTAGLVPTQRLESVAGHWQNVTGPLTVLEPSIDKLCLGIIEPEEIPEDRLGPVQANMRGRRPCK
jgi:hypothetical protein